MKNFKIISAAVFAVIASTGAIYSVYDPNDEYGSDISFARTMGPEYVDYEGGNYDAAAAGYQDNICDGCTDSAPEGMVEYWTPSGMTYIHKGTLGSAAPHVVIQDLESDQQEVAAENIEVAMPTEEPMLTMSEPTQEIAMPTEIVETAMPSPTVETIVEEPVVEQVAPAIAVEEVVAEPVVETMTVQPVEQQTPEIVFVKVYPVYDYVRSALKNLNTAVHDMAHYLYSFIAKP